MSIPAMPTMLGLSMNGGSAPGTELAALADAEEDEAAVAVVVVDEGAEEEEEEEEAMPAPPKPNRSGYM